MVWSCGCPASGAPQILRKKGVTKGFKSEAGGTMSQEIIITTATFKGCVSDIVLSSFTSIYKEFL